MKKTFFIVMSAFVCLLAGCMQGQSKQITAQMPPSQLTPPQLTTASQDYVIQSGDQLDIKFFYNPELNESVAVRPDGRIALQLIKEIRVAGMTPAQLNSELASKYAAHIRQPEITIMVRSFSAQKVFVDGEVTKPGLVGLTDHMTVMQAISQAGGLKDTARPEEVIIIRKGADNSFVATPVNLKTVLHGNGNSLDQTLIQNDVVFVPKSTIANLDLFIDQYVRKLIPIPVGFGFGID